MIRKNAPVWILLLGGLLAAASCHPRDGRHAVVPRELMHTSFEELGWLPEAPPSLTPDKAHTGKYSVRVDDSNQYSLTYHSELGLLCHHKPRRFTLSAWVWVPSVKDDAELIFSLSNPGQPDPVLHKSLYLTDSGPFEAWKFVSRDFDLPPSISTKSVLAIYLWKGRAQEPVYADDIRLTELW
ncbi:hypothetical protein MUN81_01490 [Hymenobacter sp. 5317J-9]|uniref:hypothetical protein n=1 Tax=Hymenobacter sp. 5317J-9 TaxID=2932250 RepID=UPI001FD674E7|nr:hypothetical protein [Hymenobacter sp. 5317J-9]UOQ98179.1 hypothetical protein MUN81_01490 [Hymenobacter sp. 5317J-9]